MPEDAPSEASCCCQARTPFNMIVDGPIDADSGSTKGAAVLQLANAAGAGLDGPRGGIPTRVNLQTSAHVNAER